MRITRRDFLQATAAAGVLTAMDGPIFNSLAFGAEGGAEGGNWIPSTCQGCTTWCPVEIFVQNGRAVKVKGNRYSKQNDGYVCPRGHLGLQEVYDPDRVKVPMKRTNPQKGRGVDPKFVPISWDEALNTVADKMMELRNNGESEKYMLMRGRYSYMRDVIYDVMTKVYGSPNNISHSSICAEAENFGAYYTEGMWGYRDYDVSNSKYVVIWGCDPTNSNRLVPAIIKRFGDVLDNATVAVVDPRMQTTASKAHEWLPIIPGQDGALATALAHVILTEGLWSREFVGDFKDGKNQFKAGQTVDEAAFEEKETHGIVKWWNIELKDRTPEWAAPLTGIPKEQIVRVAKGMGKAAPNVVVWLGPGAAMQVRGGYSAMAVHALNGLLGAVDNVGGTLGGAKQAANKMPKIDKYLDEVAQKHGKMKKIDQRGTKAMPAMNEGKSGGGSIANNVATGMLEKNPYEIKMAIGYMNNFAFSCTGAQRWEKAMEQLPFFVHITTNAAEMTQYADIVLPAKITMFEKWAYVKQKQNRYAHVSLIQPVIKPMWDVKADETEIPFLIAEKLKERGFSNLYDCLVNEFKDPETGNAPKTAEEFGLYSVKYYTAPAWSAEGAKLGDTINGWQEYTQKGVWNSKPYEYKKRWGGKFGKDEEKDGKKTTTGTVTHKFEFYSETLKKALTGHAEKHKTDVDDILNVCNYTAKGELAFVPHYEPPFRHGNEKEYPFTFIDYKSRLNREGRSQNLPWYYEFKKVDFGDESHEDVIQINPADASRLGIKNGDMAKVTSVTGSYLIKAKLWEGIRPGTVAKCYGQGHWAYGKTAAKEFGKTPRGVNNNEIMPFDTERLSGANVRNGGFTGVKIQKA
ncbi:MAG: molybdopterin-dependent oxidoreductase [Thermodesulfovibrionia bacterium]|nr:molybdopterin-dependent oxidoreductase [Thermodesulfovibrionia bacterium]